MIYLYLVAALVLAALGGGGYLGYRYGRKVEATYQYAIHAAQLAAVALSRNPVK